MRADALRLSPFGSRRVPMLLQTEAAECALACLAMVVGAHGHRTDLPTLRQRFSLSLKGATMADLVRMAGELHFNPRALRVEPQSRAQRLDPDGRPSLTRIRSGWRSRLKQAAALSRARGSRALIPSRCA